MAGDEVIQFSQQVQFGYLATTGPDRGPRVRPVGIKDVYGDDVCFFTFANTRKVAEIAADPRVEVVWAKEEELSQVRIVGVAEAVDDPAAQQRFREDNPSVGQILPLGADHLFLLYKIKPQGVYAAPGLVPYTQVPW